MIDTIWSIMWGIILATIIVSLLIVIGLVVLIVLDKFATERFRAHPFVRKHIVDDDPYDDDYK